MRGVWAGTCWVWPAAKWAVRWDASNLSADEIQDDGQDDEDGEDDAGGPGEDVAGLGAEGGVAAAAAEGAGEPAAAAFLDQDQQDQDARR